MSLPYLSLPPYLLRRTCSTSTPLEREHQAIGRHFPSVAIASRSIYLAGLDCQCGYECYHPDGVDACPSTRSYVASL